MDGTITERVVSVGEYLEAGDVLFKMVSINPLKLFFSFPERYSRYLSIGKEVTVGVRAYPEEVFRGIIYFINPQIDTKTRAVQIKAYVKNDEMRLKPGFFADVDMVTHVNEKAMVLPQEAVLYKGDKVVVYAIENGKAHEMPVEIGVQLQGKIEILSGINPDSVIATKGNYLLEDGRRVEIIGEIKG
jgi:membrane fusion protein (multidrug efflux system)